MFGGGESGFRIGSSNSSGIESTATEARGVVRGVVDYLCPQADKEVLPEAWRHYLDS
jgi:hypothetical protein